MVGAVRNGDGDRRIRYLLFAIFLSLHLRSGVFTKPEILLRIEGALDLALSLIFFEAIHGSWLLFILLLLVPDLAMLGYLPGARLGTVCYNLVHTLVGPFLIVAYAYLTKSQWLLPYALIWTAHIGLDRMLGFGLKYPTRFGDTHLGKDR
ncbi:MAG TPA: DUF4260 domain-containing protein [Chthoniobacterales bacterium]